jgi:hypothetical protein
MAKLTTAKRKSLPKSDFAIPSKRAYPVDTPNRARNAKARVSEFGTPAEKAAVVRKVASTYPSIGKKGKK